MVFKFKNSILVQKSINSAIQRLLFFFQIELCVRYFMFSDRAQSWCSIKSAIKDIYLVQKFFRAYGSISAFFRSSSELVSRFNNSVLVQKSNKSAFQRHLFFFSSESNKSAIQRHLFFFSSEIEQERDPKTFNFFQIELWVDIHFFLKSSSELVSKFKNSIRLWKPIQSTIYRLLNFFQSELWFGF